MQKWIGDNVEFTFDHCNVFESKSLLAAMRNVVPGLKDVWCGDHLRSTNDVRDQMHVPSTGTVGISREITWKTQPVVDGEPNKRAQMEAWLNKSF